MPQPTDAIGPYRLLRLTGAGAMADVWQAEHVQTGQPAALKLLRATNRFTDDDQEAERRFLAEAHTARVLVHPDIVAVLDAGHTEGGQPWIALEWVSGLPLTVHTQAAQLLPVRTALGVGQRVARALAHAHARGVVHRDIKPENILVDQLGSPGAQIKIADFGVARAEDSSATQTGMILGTPAYMAPEQLAGAPANPLGDLYSLGVVLFELLTGRRPLEAHSMGEWLRRISQEPATPLRQLRPDLPEAVGQVVDSLLERDPARRPGRGDEVALALAACMAQL